MRLRQSLYTQVESNFPRLRWLGITGSVYGDLVDALARSRPFSHVACCGGELGTDQWDDMDDVYVQDKEVDFFEQWLLGAENESDDEMEDDVDLAEPLRVISGILVLMLNYSN
ncbi:F-box/LRR-repeat protein 10-like [Olea europaea var. sylvestris]|uniref:F-box/LRR-repeat protein 10-like n=1 Tax=Olea europaea var. sylvestris TaxID=158386 RepID=UPI000C1CFA37|nr:F-box/LRR-repeat protein 10-like [Olea europaea var. sylvestris]